MSESLLTVKQMLRDGKKDEAQGILDKMSGEEISDNLKTVERELIEELERLHEQGLNIDELTLLKQKESRILAFTKTLQVGVENDEILELIVGEIERIITQEDYKPNSGNILKEIDNILYEETVRNARNEDEDDFRVGELEALTKFQKQKIEEKDNDIIKMTTIIQDLRDELDKQSTTETSDYEDVKQTQIIDQLNNALEKKHCEIKELVDQIADLKQQALAKSAAPSGIDGTITPQSLQEENQQLKDELEQLRANFQEEVNRQVDEAYNEMDAYFQQFVDCIDAEKEAIWRDIESVREEIKNIRHLNVKLNLIEVATKQLATLKNPLGDCQEEVKAVKEESQRELEELKQLDRQYIDDLNREHEKEIALLTEKIKCLESECSADQPKAKVEGPDPALVNAVRQGVRAVSGVLYGLKQQVQDNTMRFYGVITRLHSGLEDIFREALQKGKQERRDMGPARLQLPNTFLDAQTLLESRYSAVQRMRGARLLHRGFVQEVYQAYDCIVELLQSDGLYELFRLDKAYDLINHIRDNYSYAMDYFCNEQLLRLFNGKIKYVFGRYSEEHFTAYFAVCQVLMMMVLDGYEARETREVRERLGRRAIVFPSFVHVESGEVLNALAMDCEV